MEFLYEDLIFFVLIFIRISGIFFFTPFFSSNATNRIIKGGFAFSIAIILYSVVPKDSDLLKDIRFYQLLFLVIKELMVGLIIGYFMIIVFSIVQIAAQAYSMQMGLGMVNVLDPISQVQLPVLGQFKYLFLLSIFFIFGMHRHIISVLIDSFYKFKIGTLTYNTNALVSILLKDFSYYFMLALKLALPIMGVLFIVDITLGIMARIAPQMNVFFIGMPLKLMVGFFVMISFVPYLLKYFKIVIEESAVKLVELVTAILG